MLGVTGDTNLQRKMLGVTGDTNLQRSSGTRRHPGTDGAESPPRAVANIERDGNRYT